MKRTGLITATVGTALVGAAALFSPLASAGSNVAWGVTIGGPGYAISAGQPAYGNYYGAPYRPYYRPYYPHYRPVVVTPRVVYAPPRPYYYAPPVVVAPRPVYYGGY